MLSCTYQVEVRFVGNKRNTVLLLPVNRKGTVKDLHDTVWKVFKHRIEQVL